MERGHNGCTVSGEAETRSEEDCFFLNRLNITNHHLGESFISIEA